MSSIYRGQKSGKLHSSYSHHYLAILYALFARFHQLFLIKLVLSSPGPMAKDVDSLALFMQAVLCDHMFTLDPTVPPVPFNMQVCPLKGFILLPSIVFAFHLRLYFKAYTLYS